MKNFLLKNAKTIFLVILLISVGFIARLMDLPPNFSPIASIALFSGWYFRKKAFFLLPVAILFLSDLILGFYQWQVMLAVYFSFTVILFTGKFIKKRSNLKILAGTLLGAVLFYLSTNFAVWFFTPWYAKSLEGLMLSYTLALPFFKNTLMGNMFFTFSIFAAYDLVVYLGKKIGEFGFINNMKKNVKEVL